MSAGDTPATRREALVTLESTERMMGRAYEALLAGNVNRAKALLIAASCDTSHAIVNAQVDSATTGAIGREAGARVKAHIAALDAEDAAVAEVLTPLYAAACTRVGEADLALRKAQAALDAARAERDQFTPR